MKKESINVTLLTVFLFATLSFSVYGKVNNLFYVQAFSISAETPKVVLEQGTASTSTIYTNSTSAKLSVSSPVSLEYGYAFVASDKRVFADDTVDPVDDPEAVLNITLSKDSHVFIIYNAGNQRGSDEDAVGKGCAINIDGSDVAFSWQSPYGTDAANSVTVVYATYLTAGSHVIKGRFFGFRIAIGAPVYRVGIDKRQLVVFWFSSVTAEYVRSTVSVSTTSSSPVDDPEAILNLTLSEDSVAFIVYNAGNKRGSAEPAQGKGITINIDGIDIATKQWQSPFDSNEANSVTIIYATTLSAGSHVIKGRFFSNAAGSTTTIDERQLIVFSFPTNLVSYSFKESATSVATSSGTPVDDTEAILNFTLTEDSNSLIMYTGGNPSGATEDYDGKGLLLNINGTDQSNSTSWQSLYWDDEANSVTSLWCQELLAGAYLIKGRFFANYPATVTISSRQFLILVFPSQQQTTTHDYVLKVTNKVTDTWKIRLRTYAQSNIERLSNCTIYFYDGVGVSRQIYVLEGTYNQQYGDRYDLNGLGVVYIAMIVSASAAGTSYIFAYLEVLIPNTSTYNLMIITFEIL
jgi:hypothetical protein